MSKFLSLFWAAAMLGIDGAAVAQTIAPPPPPPAQEAPVVQTAKAALDQDAVAYATLFGLAIDDAEQRLRAQEASTAFTDQLRMAYHDRLAGISIEQQPFFHIQVLLTGEEPVTPQDAVVEGRLIPVAFRTSATATLDQLQTALQTKQAGIRAALGHPPGMGIDQRTGELVIIVAASDLSGEGRQQLTARLADIAGVPVRVRSIDRPETNLAAEGGTRLVGSNPGDPQHYLCTAGFAVTDGQRDAIATAAHCPDELTYRDTGGSEHALPFVGQWGWGYQDVQINASDEQLLPYVFADTGKTVSRPVTTERSAASMRAGDVVCHRGERTGYSCGIIELTSFAPAGDLCGGACSPTWITVATSKCGGGDSGAPVFIGTTALGILKGGSYRADGRCSFFFYMSTDYLPAGWRLLLAPAS